MDKLLVFIIIIGLVVCSYNAYQWKAGTKGVKSISQEEIQPHTTVISSVPKIEDRITSASNNPIMSNQLDSHEIGENMATLSIPAIEKAYSVFWGTDDKTLKQGVGMYISQWTTTPDQLGHTVVSGHRDTVFIELGSVSEGDEVVLDYEGKRFTYVVKAIWITDAEDRSVIVKKDHAMLTITTCYPFDYFGSAPDRYIIQAELVNANVY